MPILNNENSSKFLRKKEINRVKKVIIIVEGSKNDFKSLFIKNDIKSKFPVAVFNSNFENELTSKNPNPEKMFSSSDREYIKIKAKFIRTRRNIFLK